MLMIPCEQLFWKNSDMNSDWIVIPICLPTTIARYPTPFRLSTNCVLVLRPSFFLVFFVYQISRVLELFWIYFERINSLIEIENISILFVRITRRRTMTMMIVSELNDSNFKDRNSLMANKFNYSISGIFWSSEGHPCLSLFGWDFCYRFVGSSKDNYRPSERTLRMMLKMHNKNVWQAKTCLDEHRNRQGYAKALRSGVAESGR